MAFSRKKMSWQALNMTLAAVLVIAPPAVRADDENREPASTSKPPAPLSEVKLAPAFNDAFDRINELKTFDDFVSEMKRSLSEADQKALAEIAAKVNKQDPNFKSKVTMSYDRGQAVIRYDGKVFTYKNVDFDNYLISIDGKQVDLSPTIPFNDKIELLSSIINKRFSTAGHFSLLLPKAHAGGTFLAAAGTLVAIPAVAALALLGYNYARDGIYFDYLRKIHNEIIDVKEICDFTAEFKENEKNRFRLIRVKAGKGRNGRQIYRWQKEPVDDSFKLERESDVQKVIDLKVAKLGTPPAEDSEENAKYTERVNQIKKMVNEAWISKGKLALPEEVARRAEAIRHAVCEDFWGKPGGVPIQNFRLHGEVSFQEQCNEATDLKACVDSLRSKNVLSEEGINRMKKGLDDVEIDSDHRRQLGLPGRPKGRAEKISQ